MTPDEIRVAIRMLDQIVIYDDKYPVIYTGDRYVVRAPGCDRPLFGKDGGFSQNWAGYLMFNSHRFKVVDKLPDPPRKTRRKVAKK